MSQRVTNWIVGPTLILLGLVHNIVGGRLVANWLATAEPRGQASVKPLGDSGDVRL